MYLKSVAVGLRVKVYILILLVMAKKLTSEETADIIDNLCDRMSNIILYIIFYSHTISIIYCYVVCS